MLVRSHAGEPGQHGIVKQAVGGEGADPVRAGLSVEVRERTACLPHEDPGHVKIRPRQIVKRVPALRGSRRSDRDLDIVAR